MSHPRDSWIRRKLSPPFGTTAAATAAGADDVLP